ncbi:unnamed protein product [Cutaneotrichosporon oleaginosum]
MSKPSHDSSRSEAAPSNTVSPASCLLPLASCSAARLDDISPSCHAVPSIAAKSPNRPLHETRLTSGGPEAMEAKERRISRAA